MRGQNQTLIKPDRSFHLNVDLVYRVIQSISFSNRLVHHFLKEQSVSYRITMMQSVTFLYFLVGEDHYVASQRLKA